MKLLFFSFVFLFAFIAETHAQVVMGEANVFSYDNAGNRIKREYFASIQINRQAPGTTYPTDTVRMAQLQKDVLIKAYPNPVTEQLIVENFSWNPGSKAELRIFDIAGKFISSKSFSQGKDQVGFQQVVPGTYQVHYYIDGKFVKMWKIVKQ